MVFDAAWRSLILHVIDRCTNSCGGLIYSPNRQSSGIFLSWTEYVLRQNGRASPVQPIATVPWLVFRHQELPSVRMPRNRHARGQNPSYILESLGVLGRGLAGIFVKRTAHVDSQVEGDKRLGWRYRKRVCKLGPVPGMAQ